MEVVVRQIRHDFDHRQIKSFAAFEIRQADFVRVHEFADVSAILFVRHARINRSQPFNVKICLGGRELLFCENFGLNFFCEVKKFFRRGVRVIFEHAVEEHHLLEVKRRGFAIKSSVHVKGRDSVFGRNVIRAEGIDGVLHELNDFLFGRRVIVPIFKICRRNDMNRGNLFAGGGVGYAERAEGNQSRRDGCQKFFLQSNHS